MLRARRGLRKILCPNAAGQAERERSKSGSFRPHHCYGATYKTNLHSVPVRLHAKIRRARRAAPFGCAQSALPTSRACAIFLRICGGFGSAQGTLAPTASASARSENRRIHYKNLCAFAANTVKRQAGFPHKADAHGEPCAINLSSSLFPKRRKPQSAAQAGSCRDIFFIFFPIPETKEGRERGSDGQQAREHTYVDEAR